MSFVVPESETPETDAACQDEPRGPSVNADFARSLERRLSIAQARIAMLEEELRRSKNGPA